MTEVPLMDALPIAPVNREIVWEPEHPCEWHTHRLAHSLYGHEHADGAKPHEHEEGK